MSAPSAPVGSPADPLPLGPLPPHTCAVTRADVIRYAAAGGDLNPIHWSDREAVRAGLPGVVAHGMLTMGIAAGVVADWAGPAWTVRELRASFTRPVVVPDDDQGVLLTVEGEVAPAPAPGQLRIVLGARVGEVKVLARAAAVLIAAGPR